MGANDGDACVNKVVDSAVSCVKLAMETHEIPWDASCAANGVELAVLGGGGK
jgi:hypothetical protein